MKNVLLFFSLLGFYAAYGQSISFELQTDIEVYDSFGNILSLSEIGGMNQPQFYNLDINNDGILDVFMFDRSGAKVTSLIHDGKGNYTYKPEYDHIYPKRFSGWVVFKDYNSDGLPDLWFNNIEDNEISLYRNSTKAGDAHAKFELADIDLRFYNFGNFNDGRDTNDIICDPINIPAIEDVDGDGDIDFLSLQNSGQGIYLFLNNTVETGKPLDPPSFEMADHCWGSFTEYDGSNRIDFKRGKYCGMRIYRHKKKHSGGSSLLLLDYDEDGDMDLVLGNAGLSNLNLLINGRVEHKEKLDTMVSSDSLFPSNTIAASINVFPAAYYLDIDGDKIRDLVVAVNMADARSYRYQETQNLLYYKNKGKDNHPNFEYQKFGFIKNKMADHGGYSYPLLYDIDGDDDLDLILATNGNLKETGDSTFYLNLYMNIGTVKTPKFRFMKKDYLGLKKDSIRFLAPDLADIDRDGVDELIVGHVHGGIDVFEITGSGIHATASLRIKNAYGIQASETSDPMVVDVDSDGRLDVLVGDFEGNTLYYRDTSKSNEPGFKLITKSFGNAFSGYYKNEPFEDPNTGKLRDSFVFIPYMSACPSYVDLDGNGNPEFVLGDAHGNLKIFRNVENQDTFKQVVSDPFYTASTKTCGRYSFGTMAKQSFGDLNGDGKLDVVIGSDRGGFQIAYGSGDCNIGVEEVRNNTQTLRLYPNPSTGEVHIKGVSAVKAQLIVVNINGERVLSKSINPALGVNLSNLTNGIYAVQLITESERYVGKLIKHN
jgi:hypothetical protein